MCYGVASFYTQFRFEKPGEQTIRVCLGTACHVQSGEQLSQEIQNILGIAPVKPPPIIVLISRKSPAWAAVRRPRWLKSMGKSTGK